MLLVWHVGGCKTQFEPATTSYGSYGMAGFPMHDFPFHVESDFEPSTMPGCTLIPYHAERFGSASHIAPSVSCPLKVAIKVLTILDS